MRDLLFRLPTSWSWRTSRGRAVELSLDVEQFLRDLDGAVTRARSTRAR